MLNRRVLLGSAIAGTALPAAAQAPSRAASPQLASLFDALFREELERNPERATALGLDKGEFAPLKSRLTDASLAGFAARRASTAADIQRLQRVDRRALSPADQVSLDTVLYKRRTLEPILNFDVGGQDSYSPSPYAVSQITGAYRSVPVFLDTNHRIQTAADAEAYLARLEAFASVLDQNTERLRHDAGLGVVPPDFLLNVAANQLAAMRVPPEQSMLVVSIARRTAEKGLSETYRTRAASIYTAKIMPAVARQLAAVQALIPRAGSAAGVQRFRNGDAFYAAALRYSTSTTLSPAEVHKLGLDQAAEITARLDGLLKARGLTQGTVSDRVRALYRDPTQLYPNTDAGKSELIAYLNSRLTDMRARLPGAFHRPPAFPFEVRRVPVGIEAGAAGAYAEPPALDGSRPGLVYFNLRDSAEWPKWRVDTTVFHEGLPGHQLEQGYLASNKAIPLIRQGDIFSGYSEGWGLYAEQLADELGAYETAPIGRIGYLQAQLFRAGRCVVDTGLHNLGWSRERAIETLVGVSGESVGSTSREIDRYCALPGQACAYKIGHTVWTRARARAQAALGARFDLRDFHEAGLTTGRVPLEILDGVIDRWVAERRG